MRPLLGNEPHGLDEMGRHLEELFLACTDLIAQSVAAPPFTPPGRLSTFTENRFIDWAQAHVVFLGSFTESRNRRDRGRADLNRDIAEAIEERGRLLRKIEQLESDLRNALRVNGMSAELESEG